MTFIFLILFSVLEIVISSKHSFFLGFVMSLLIEFYSPGIGILSVQELRDWWPYFVLGGVGQGRYVV
jgi:hypothetical protein